MNNLERLACAMGYPGITLEFLQDMTLQGPGAFSRLAAQHHLSDFVAREAKSEYDDLMAQGRAMFAPMRADPS
jgi:hypothetical protein